ncbi:LysR family transcriptional regulator [Gordonia sp. NPDC003425]
MDLRQLDYFVVLSEERSFTRAATRLHVVQSTVSAAVKVLEKELGVTLVHRSSRTFALTAAGAELLTRARDLLAAERSAVDAVRGTSGRVSGQLRVGTLASSSPLDVAALMGRFHARHPDVDIRMVTSAEGSTGLRASVLDGSLDAAFSSIGATHRSLLIDELAAVPLDVIVPRGHRLESSERISLAELVDDPFVDFPQGFGHRTVVDDAFRDAGLGRHVAVEVVGTASILEYVRHGLGVALLARTASTAPAEIRRIPVAGPAPMWRVYFIRHADRERTTALAALLAMLRMG